MFQCKADRRLNGKIKVDGVNAKSFITWKLRVTDELDSATVNKKNVKVLDAFGLPQEIEVSCDKDNMTIIIIQKFKCDYNINYTLLINNVHCQKGRFLQTPLSVNYVFTGDNVDTENLQELTSVPKQNVVAKSGTSRKVKRVSGNSDFNVGNLPKPVDKLSMILSIISIIALIFGLFPFEAISVFGMFIWMFLSLSLTAVPVIVLIMCNRKKYIRNVKLPKIISIIVIISFVVMNVLTAVGIPLYFSFMPIMRI